MSFRNLIRRKINRLPFIDRKLRKKLPLPYVKDGIVYRLMNSDDSIEELTSLINRAFHKHIKAGLQYLGAEQNSDVTRKRIQHSYTIIAIFENRIIGTVSYKPPWECRGAEWFNKPGVAKYNQRAIDPDMQSRGIGGTFVDLVEQIARLQGAKEIASDNPEELVDRTNRKIEHGYRIISYHQWKHTNYQSVILSKALNVRD